jgi:GNAT superfamily N-acetyltransferase
VIEVRAARRDEDVAAYLETVPKIWPGSPTLEGFRHWEQTWNAHHALALVDGEPAGTGWTGRQQESALWCGFGVVPALRRRGVGTALYDAISDVARSRDADGLVLEVLVADPDSLEWVQRRGFVGVARQEALALDLASLEPAPVDAPAGVEIVTRAERPDLGRQMYAVGIEAGRDIPGLDGGNDPSFESWAAFELDRPSRDPELCFIALAEGRVIGFASLDVFPDDVFHGLTAVARGSKPRHRLPAVGSLPHRGLGRAPRPALDAQAAAAAPAGRGRSRDRGLAAEAPCRTGDDRRGHRPPCLDDRQGAAPGRLLSARAPFP